MAPKLDNEKSVESHTPRSRPNQSLLPLAKAKAVKKATPKKVKKAAKKAVKKPAKKAAKKPAKKGGKGKKK